MERKLNILLVEDDPDDCNAMSSAIDNAFEDFNLLSITNSAVTALKIFNEENPDVIILDPPRAGVDEPVIEVILRAAPERIVYVSCNPATQARDLALLDAQYEVKAVQPVDMFPHTHHVENVVKLVKRQ